MNDVVDVLMTDDDDDLQWGVNVALYKLKVSALFFYIQ